MQSFTQSTKQELLTSLYLRIMINIKGLRISLGRVAKIQINATTTAGKFIYFLLEGDRFPITMLRGSCSAAQQDHDSEGAP